MNDHFEIVELEGNDPKFNMPYVPAIKVHSGTTVYVAGVTAAPVYHTHPHVAAEFDDLPLDPEQQARLAYANLQRILRAAGGDMQHVVQLFRFIKDLDRNQAAIGRATHDFFGDHIPTSTTVEIVRVATDPRLVLELTAVAVLPE